MDLASAAFDPMAALRVILHGLRAALGGWGLEAKLGILLHRRVGEAALRIERMLVRFRAGKIWRRTAGAGVQASRAGANRRANGALPRRFGWLVKIGGYRAAGYRSQLELVLQTPDMAALLAAAPQAGRIMRPLCRALALEWPTPEPKTEKIKTIRPRKPRPKPEPFRIPLPRGVISAARRAGFGKMC
jgi:hypothetical protein